MTLKGDAKFKGKLNCGLKNDLMNLLNFHASSWKSGNLHFDGLLLSKAYEDLDEKVQKSYVSRHWRVMQSLNKNWLLVPKMTWGIISWTLTLMTLKKIQTLKKNWLFVWKMTWGISWTLTRAVESLKICTLLSYFCRKYVMFELIKYRGAVSCKMTYGFKNGISNFVNFHTSCWK